ncbi:alpha/beta hydrolase [Poritiphilus flavus]|uniref:Prolyl oligopeptidase family serine peptidase n=1 Tax=Poritiphilus flavus TaxID=2697053 RepID=A0A6L9ECG0_9FLAO|nr:alpha/beta hydrolase [Poritiphilus flavus]NAS12332.1 prolyl oligopeptidase family serine peptidase [Poritiphilus flavus]
MNKPTYFFLAMLLFSTGIYAQDTIMPLWPESIPNRISENEKEVREKGDILRISKVQIPSIEVYLPAPANRNGQAVLIFPGGGYHILAYDWEGTDIAKFLNSRGIAGIVVKYRLPTSEALTEKHKVPLQDAQRAMRLVRSRAAEWKIATDKIGIMGFSAGGHLASTLGTHFNEDVYKAKDSLDQMSARPDFMTLVYPVITFTGEATHQGSKKALIGENPPSELVAHYSNELQVSSETPPTLLIHAVDDLGVPVENSLLFFEALKANKVPATMHIYPKGGHGFSLALSDPYLRSWTDRLLEWLETMD